MLQSIDTLQEYTIHAQDGEIGRIQDFLFDDTSWAIRYLVVHTGNWLTRRDVLVVPDALDVPVRNAEVLRVNLTRQQIEDSPLLELARPISRQNEAELYQYYGWPGYWAAETAPEADEDLPGSDPHLRSMREVIGYHIRARDGEVGHVEDFIADDELWMLRYMVVDTRNWLPGKNVLVAPTWVETINWNAHAVNVDLKRQTIKNSPAYDPSQPLERDYEAELYDYYDQPHYWAGM